MLELDTLLDYMYKMNYKTVASRTSGAILVVAIALTMISIAGCRDDEIVVRPEHNDTGGPIVSKHTGLYVLNEGNMGSNKATLDYLDFSTGVYSRNIYPSRNPREAMELGDVGNDIKVYGGSLWIVVNQSNKVEVTDARTAVSRGRVEVPNCRYMAFKDGFAYVSSYVGRINSKSVLGAIYKIDTLSLRVVDRCIVGYQPEEICVVGNKLYVANSGGYNPMQGMAYDRRVSIIDLRTFKVNGEIDVAPNLFRLRTDKHGNVWVSSRGDYASTPSRLYKISNDRVESMFDIPVTDFDFLGDSLVYQNEKELGVINIRTSRILTRQLAHMPAGESVQTPYGVIVDASNGNIYVMDATNYVSSGRLFCFDQRGAYKWSVRTGDIPGHACFAERKVDVPSVVPPASGSAYISAVDEYVPAPGQFINVLPAVDADDNVDSVLKKCTAALKGGFDGMISLGGFGGYITFHFDHSIRNISGEPDLLIKGNAMVGASEPGIVMVSKDENRNGLPDDQWFELKGSADTDSVGKVTFGYRITYTENPMRDIPWTDSRGVSGTVPRNEFHKQEYFPMWLHGQLTFEGTLLPRNGYRNSFWVLSAFRFGYVDNLPTDEGSSFDIDWAVDSHRNPVHLDQIDFVRVYNAQNQVCGWLGETSTEVRGAKDLHYLN